MPAEPLEHRCRAEGAAGGQEKAQQWLTAALAARAEHLVPELGFLCNCLWSGEGERKGKPRGLWDALQQAG